MKLLQIDVTFLLPEGFDGDGADALCELASYLRSALPADPGQDKGPDRLAAAACANRYKRVGVCLERGHRMIGNGNVVDDASGEWQQVGHDLQTLPPKT